MSKKKKKTFKNKEKKKIRIDPEINDPSKYLPKGQTFEKVSDGDIFNNISLSMDSLKNDPKRQLIQNPFKTFLILW